MRWRPSQDNDLVFEFETGSKRHLQFILGRYPMLDPAYFDLSKSADPEEIAEDKEVLEESMTEEQRENRGQIERWILQEEKFEPSGETFRLRLTQADAHWLLKVVNDVRIGCWLRLGSPDEDNEELAIETPENLQDYMVMRACGSLQYVLLDAFDKKRNPPAGEAEGSVENDSD